MTKPIKGVILDWTIQPYDHDPEKPEEYISGICAYHVDAVPISGDAMLNNSIIQGHPVSTSAVERIEDYGPVKIAETKNSRYLLVRLEDIRAI